MGRDCIIRNKALRRGIPVVPAVRFGPDAQSPAGEWDVLLVEGVPTQDNNALLGMASGLGTLSDDGITSASNEVEDRFVHLVTARRTAALDPFGNSMLSTTNRSMRLHSDEYFSRTPSQFVLLLCVRPSSSGGDTHYSLIDKFINHLSEEDLAILRAPIFPSQAGMVPILSKVEERWSIRFNRLELQRAIRMRTTGSLRGDAARALKNLEKEARRSSSALKLATGQCLIIRNDRVLHGRSSFPSDTDRLLKRVRVK